MSFRPNNPNNSAPVYTGPGGYIQEIHQPQPTRAFPFPAIEASGDNIDVSQLAILRPPGIVPPGTLFRKGQYVAVVWRTDPGVNRPRNSITHQVAQIEEGPRVDSYTGKVGYYVCTIPLWKEPVGTQRHHLFFDDNIRHLPISRPFRPLSSSTESPVQNNFVWAGIPDKTKPQSLKWVRAVFDKMDRGKYRVYFLSELGTHKAWLVDSVILHPWRL